MTTLSIGFGHVRGIGPAAGTTLPTATITATEDAILDAAMVRGGRRIAVTRGHGVDENGAQEPCSTVVVELPDDADTQGFLDALAWLAEAAQQRCFAVLAGSTVFVGPVPAS